MSLVLVGCLGGLVGCGTGNPYPPGSFDRGAHYNTHGKHHEAVEALESFIRHNPTDSLAARAQYLKALSYLEINEYPLAAVELQILRKDYPTSDLIEDAFFQEGVAYYRQVGRIERDLSGAYQARLHFLKFRQQYSESVHGDAVRDYLLQISNMIVRKRLNAAEVYRHLGRHHAAVIVLQTTLSEEDDSSLLDVVLLRLGEAAERDGEPDTAAAAYQRLLDDFPGSPHAATARAALGAVQTAQEP